MTHQWILAHSCMNHSCKELASQTCLVSHICCEQSPWTGPSHSLCPRALCKAVSAAWGPRDLGPRQRCGSETCELARGGGPVEGVWGLHSHKSFFREPSLTCLLWVCARVLITISQAPDTLPFFQLTGISSSLLAVPMAWNSFPQTSQSLLSLLS